MSLTERLNELASDLSKSDEGWVQFVNDHFSYIRDNSPPVTISLGSMFRYRYRPEDFMRAFGYDPNITWVMMLINELKTRLEFVDLEEVLIPPIELITELRSQYDTYLTTVGESEQELLESV